MILQRFLTVKKQAYLNYSIVNLLFDKLSLSCMALTGKG